MNSKKIFEESLKYMPGGVNSPVRAFNEMGIDPIVVKEGNGVILTDEDGKEYIDFLYAWGPLLLGHKDEDIMKAVHEALEKGISFGTATEYELILAKHICNTLPQVDMLRMVNSGTEATMSAVKLARGYTKREKIVKFNGCYHGHYDGFLIKAGSGIMTENIPGSLGVTKGAIENTLTCDYNSIEGIRELFKTQGEEIAAVIVEAVAGNMGVIKADKEFLLELRRLCDEYGSVLIFDEVMTGFRVSYEGAGGLYGIKSDLSTYAKIMGGGFPCGAYGGKKEIMECLSPLGGVYQAGTMSGNPVVMAAGYAALKKLYENKENYYEHLENLGAKLQKGIEDIAKEKGIPVLVSRCGSMLTPFFTEKQEVKNYEDALTCNREMYKKFFKHLYKNGIYIPQSQFESSFISVKHKDEHIEKYLEAFKTL